LVQMEKHEVDMRSLERSLSTLLRKEGNLHGGADKSCLKPGGFVALNPRYLVEVQRDGMSEAWRQTIVAFFLELSERFEAGGEESMDPNLIPAAMNLLDRYLSVKSCDAVMFQQAALIALQISSKIHGFRPIVPPLLVRLSNNRFTPRQLLVMEKDMLMTLRWDLHPSTVVRILDHFILIALKDVDLEATPSFDRNLRECLDLTLGDYEILRFPPSYIAWAVLEKAFAQTRTQAESELVRTVTPASVADLADGAGGGAQPTTTVLDLRELRLADAATDWKPCAKLLRECTEHLNRLYCEHKGEAADEPELSNADADAEVAAYDKPSTPGVLAKPHRETPSGVESERIFDPNEASPVAVSNVKSTTAAVAPAPAAATAAGAPKGVSKRPMSPNGLNQAGGPASNKRRKL